MLKTLISHLRTQIDLIQCFRSIFYFYLKTMHILQTKRNSFGINSKELHEYYLLLHEPNTSYF